MSETVDMWQDWGSRRTFGLKSKTWPQRVEETCNDESPNRGQDWCSREKGHPGRHVATAGAPTFCVISAWPGTHEPTVADLDDPAPDGVVIPVESLPTHESDQAAREAAMRPAVGGWDVDHEVCQETEQRLRRLLADVVKGRECRTPKNVRDDRGVLIGFVTCGGCATCLAAAELGLTADGIRWTS